MQEENQNSRFDPSRVFNPKIIRRGVIAFVAITVVAFVGLYMYHDGTKNLEVWKTLHWKYLLFGLVFVFNDLYLGGLRNHIFLAETNPGISQMVSIKANLANIFMGAVTPTQSGGGPAQWYIFYKNGVSIPDMIGTSFYNLISTILFFPISGALAIYVLKDKVPHGFISQLTTIGFTVFLTLTIIIFIALFAQHVFNFIIRSISGLISKVKTSWGEKFGKLSERAIIKLDEYRARFVEIIKNKPQLMVYSFLLTIVLYFNKYACAYLFAVAFGLNVSLWSIVAVMAVNYLLLYFAPSPGGSGIAEVSITGMLAPFVTYAIAPSITLLHRSFMVFLPAIIGAFVILEQLNKEKLE